jgi:Zn finger protein HypA/HybF involved in hydrogenase expression
MRTFKCFECAFERECDDNVTISFCPACLSSMEVIDDGNNVYN